MSPSPLRARLFELPLERLASPRIAAKISRGLAETDQLLVRHSAQTLQPFFIARFERNGHAGLPAEVGTSFYQREAAASQGG